MRFEHAPKTEPELDCDDMPRALAPATLVINGHVVPGYTEDDLNQTWNPLHFGRRR